jgi:hypothetical protein
MGEIRSAHKLLNRKPKREQTTYETQEQIILKWILKEQQISLRIGSVSITIDLLLGSVII